MKRQPNPVTIACAFAATLFTASAIGFGQVQQPAELKVLKRYVGTWLHDATVLPSKSVPKKTTRRAIEQTEWTLSDSFVMGRSVNETDGLKSFSFFTVNRSDRTIYSYWYFDSRGSIAHLKGKWSEAKKTMSFTMTDLPPKWKGMVTHKFSGDSYKSIMMFTNEAGETIMNRHDLRKRLAETVGKKMFKKWATIGKPNKPLSDELKKLKPFVGEWDSEFSHRPSVVSPKGGISKGSFTAKWILDGHFLLFRSQVGNHQSKSVVGYDTNKKAYRYIRFTNTGLIDDSIGQWNRKTRSFVWKLVNASDGITRSSTSRIDGIDAIHHHVLARNKDGKVHMDLTIRSTRKK